MYGVANAIASNGVAYYAFGAWPVPTANVADTAADDSTALGSSNWQMMFGKRIQTSDVAAAAPNYAWTSNTVYTRYDSTQPMTGLQFYTVGPPTQLGAFWNLYVCIDNANGAPSTSAPTLVQQTTFQTADGYRWRYVGAVSDQQYVKFATEDWVPIFANAVVQLSAMTYSGVEVVPVTQGGSGYATYDSGMIGYVANSQCFQIVSNTGSSTYNGFYVDSDIYVYNATQLNPAQLLTVTGYVANASGNWIFVSPAMNTSYVTAYQTLYSIAPAVAIASDGVIQPQAYSVVNSQANSIQSVVVIEPGSEVSWANVAIVANSYYGSGASAYAIVPPPGGFGSNPAAELGASALVITFQFSNTELGTIPVGVSYSRVGLLQNPYQLNPDGTKSSVPLAANTFNQLLEAGSTPSTAVFPVGTIVQGQTSGAYGMVALSNSQAVWLTGDKTFSAGEVVASLDGMIEATVDVTYLGALYARDLRPIYVQNINTVTRTATTSEAYRLVISI